MNLYRILVVRVVTWKAVSEMGDNAKLNLREVLIRMKLAKDCVLVSLNLQELLTYLLIKHFSL